MSTPEIAIPTTSIVSNTPKPYTLYNISVRSPLRSLTIQKRFSEFVALNSALTSQISSSPPVSLPSRSWFSNTVSSPALTESRRAALENYLMTINGHEDSRWRDAQAFRSFLNLPPATSSSSSKNASAASSVRNHATTNRITDPVVWLDTYRQLKTTLHDARQSLTKRDQATAPQAQHEASAAAKKYLVRSGTLTATLSASLDSLSRSLGDGEVLRRKNLVENARREKEGLDSLLSAMVQKTALDASLAEKQQHHSNGSPAYPAVASGDRQSLLQASNGPHHQRPTTGGRVLGKETTRTRALDNKGVLQLQQQLMAEQDEDVDALASAVRRQRELGEQINRELTEQEPLLRMLDEDVDRVQGKMDVAKKRLGKIS